MGCCCASRPVGGPLAIHGHGGRERVALGLLEPTGRAVSVVVLARRYACCRCNCIMMVVPRDLGPWRRYTLATIALAMVGYAEGECLASLRRRLSPDKTFEEGWPSVHRWLRAVQEGKLFRWIRGVSELSGRRLAERVAAVLAAESGNSNAQASIGPLAWEGVMAVLRC